MYGVFMAEVAVETATGKTTVEKMTLVADIGKVNNRLVTDGQLYGGMAQGIGLALTEDFEDIKKHSTLVGAGFPYIKQIPGRHGADLRGNAATGRPLWRGRRGRASPDQPPCGHYQRHIQCLRLAHHQTAGPA
jgi:hypothetical protein